MYYIRKMLTCAPRAQDKKSKVEIKSWKLCILNCESFNLYLFYLFIY